MPFSYAQYAGNGSATTFSVPFPYLLKAHVKLFYGYNLTSGAFTSELVDGVGFTWTSGTQVQTTAAPAVGQTLTIVRQTPSNALVVQWQDGSNLVADDLQDSSLQTLYAVQEQEDVVSLSAAESATAATSSAAAVATANAASTTANGIAGTANTALSNSSAAVTTANAASATANGIAGTANTALSNSSAAVTTANAASTTANAASTTANGIAGAANTALSNSSAAVTTANAANATANGIAGTANTALSNSSAAVTTANAASATANAAQAAAATKITAGTASIVNADVNASAGIAASALSFTQVGSGATARTIDSKLKDVVSVKDFGAVGDGVTDDTAAIQAAINYALSLAAYANPYLPWVAVTVQFPAAIYKVAGNLTVPTPPVVLSLEAIGRATLLHTGTGVCLTIGNGSSYGIMPMRIKNLHFRRTASIAGSVGLLVDICSNGVYEGLGFENFEIGVKGLGIINCIFDFKRHGISGATTGIYLETKVGSGGGLRFDANLTLIQNAMFQGGTGSGIAIVTGAGVTPVGSGGCIRIDKCTFEGVTVKSIQVQNYGEVAGNGDELLVTDCWFESYGNTIAELTRTKMKFSHCFIAGGSANMFRLMDNYCGVVIEACTGYFLDNPAPNGLVTLGGTATTAALANVLVDRGGFQGLAKIHSTYPATTAGIATNAIKTFSIIYNSTYPVGNNDYNWGLSLVMDAEISKFIGPNWAMARMWFSGNDSNTSSCLLIDAVKNTAGAVTLTSVTTPPAYTITNNGTATATLTFNNDGTGRWYAMRALYQITAI